MHFTVQTQIYWSVLLNYSTCPQHGAPPPPLLYPSNASSSPLLLFSSSPPSLSSPHPLSFLISSCQFEVTIPPPWPPFPLPLLPLVSLFVAWGLQPCQLLHAVLLPPFSSSLLAGVRPDKPAMSERRSSPEDDRSSLLSRLGSDSPRPRMKYGGMFCSIEGAFENKTLNFESFSPQTQRRRGASQCSDGGDVARGGPTMVFSSGHSGHSRNNNSQREVRFNLHKIIIDWLDRIWARVWVMSCQFIFENYSNWQWKCAKLESHVQKCH